jgi:hypothetical protein
MEAAYIFLYFSSLQLEWAKEGGIGIILLIQESVSQNRFPSEASEKRPDRVYAELVFAAGNREDIRMQTRYFAPLMAICVAASPAAFADEVVKGKIFDPASGKLLFQYENKKGNTGAIAFSHTRYQELGDGKAVVAEDVLYENGKLKTYKYDQLQTQESGTIEVRDGKVFYSYVEQGKTSTDDEDFEDGMIVPDQLEETIRASWKRLEADDSVKIRLLLLERQDSVGFKLFKDKERELNGKAAVDIVMKPSSIFIAAVAPSFRVTVEKDSPHRLLEILGRLPVRMPKVNPPKKRGDWKAIDARVELDYSTPSEASPDSAAEPSSGAGTATAAP